MSSFAEGAGAALVGAIAGGALATGGALVVGRRELARRNRFELYRVVVPDLLAHLRRQRFSDEMFEAARQVARIGATTSKRDRRRAEAIFELVAESNEARNQMIGARNTTEQPSAKTDAKQAFEDLLGRAVEACETYDRWLRSRF